MSSEAPIARMRCAKSPNDLKLSDCGGRHSLCGKVAGGERSEAAGAQAVTPGAVRCSAWLGARLDSVQVWKKNLGTLELAGDSRTTGDEKLKVGKRMKLRETKAWRCRDVWHNQPPSRGRACVVDEPRGSDTELAAEAELEARNIAKTRNQE